MAGETDDEDRTEEPTQKRLDEAIKRGDVPKSQELNTLFVLGGLTLSILLLSGPVSRQLAFDLRGFLMNAHLVPDDGPGLLGVGRQALAAILATLALPFVIYLVLGAAGGAIQHRPLWTTEPLAPKLERISPLGGFKRLFSKESLVQFVKGLAKLGIVGTVVGLILWGERDRMDGIVRLDPSALMGALRGLAVELLGGVLAIFAFLALGDVVYQRLTWARRQRMTRQEMKREFKETEGNPEIKAKLRQIGIARNRRRMMAAVPSATVVVANPTHFAVALKYEAGMAAPICVAKGVDSLALRIRALAEDNDVPVVENPPLARALHASVELDAPIPVEHYKAVAEVIGYVLRLRRRPS